MKKHILKKIEAEEKRINKSIDDEVSLDKEIDEVANITASSLEKSPMVVMSIQSRDFVVVNKVYKNEKNKNCIQIAAREKTAIDVATPKILKADFGMDIKYSLKENLAVGIKALLGHITGRIKPETLD